MAGTVTITEERFGGELLDKITFAWTSSAGGAADGTTTVPYTGTVERLVTVPDAVAVPTLNYDVVVNDEDGVDVLAGAGANRSDTATEQVLGSSLAVVRGDKLALAVTNAGNAKQGTVHLYIRKA